MKGDKGLRLCDLNHGPHQNKDHLWRETLPALQSMVAGRGVSAERVFEWMRSWGTDNELPKPTSLNKSTHQHK